MGDLISREADVRLIDANALEKHLINVANTMQDNGYASYAGAMGEVAAIVHNRRTVDAEPVRHGKWIKKPYLLGTTNVCSRCGDYYGMPHGMYKYCPNCGAKMDGDK